MKLIVTDHKGLRRETCDVVETYEHGSKRFAKVEGPTISGFVEVPQNPEQPRYELLCKDCEKEHELNHEGSANLLRRIHEIKTNHQPSVETVP